MKANRTYAIFECSDCWEEFSERLPPLCADLPTCPRCGSGSRVVAILAILFQKLGVEAAL